jgi:hypothetical protein
LNSAGTIDGHYSRLETHPCVRTDDGNVWTSSLPNTCGAAHFLDYFFDDGIVNSSLDVGDNEDLIAR